MKKVYGFTLLLLTAMLLASQESSADDKHKFRLARQLSVFNAIVKDLNLFYVDSIMSDKMINKGIDAMLRNLDPYTVYYPEEKSEELKMMTTGKYAGVGSIIRFHTGKKTTVMTEPYEGMPAHKAGLRAGDEIVSIDGVKVEGMSVDSVSDRLRGEAGTKISITVKRPGTKKELTFKFERESIALPAISYYGLHDGDIGYIVLESFTENCAKEMRHAVVDLKKQGAKSFIIDLRENGGGLLNEAVDIVNLFVPKGMAVVTTKGKIAQSNETYETRREPIDTESPITVLVNGQTASASEIVAGALQDLDRAVVVGSRTYGKGLVQSTRQVVGGGYLKLTTAKYYIPSGRCVQALDYSHIIDNGTTTRVPDSLTNIFHTAAGREVRDGGGIRPDIETKPEELSTLLYELMQDMSMFDFAIDFHLKNSVIAPAAEFAISDDTYKDFTSFLKSRGFKYNLISAKRFAELKKLIEFEGFGEIAKDEIAALEKKLQTNLGHSLEHFSDEIKQMLVIEIVKLYYGQQGAIVAGLRNDPDIKEAVSVLKDTGRYEKILSPGTK
ncbi:MAG: S41 family peptidase [Bacteroidaceae bacterium]|nr:S41 family peptidase [Bacteroidaceae bacterium]